MKKKKIVALTMSAMMAISLFAGCGDNSKKENGNNSTTASTEQNNTNNPTANATDNAYGLRENTEDGTILHCFAWSFKTITESMEDIAMAGYSTIQTSPVNACYDGGDAGMELFGSGKWYYHYQPTDWKIGNYQLGTKEEFKEMCDTAHKYGIKVLVDVAPNHTTKVTEAISEDLINAVGGLDKLYHSNGMVAIANYNDRTECTLQAVGGLYDVNTENPDFQNYYIEYLNDVIACGADGFRYDTAKHIGLSDDPQDDPSLPNNFWERVTTEVTNADKLFMYGECLQDGGERLADYIDVIGATTASSYAQFLRGSFNTKTLLAQTVTNLRIGDATPNVVTWVESHDNYTGDDKTYESLDNNKVARAWSVLAAREIGTPLFFARPYGATSDNMWGTFNKIGMAGDNLYKDPIVVASNRFRNAMVGLKENIFNPEDSDSILFIERGTKGLYIYNNSTSKYEINVNTNLENGTYVDRVGGESYTVANGKITGEINGQQVIILYNEGYIDLTTPATVKVDDSTEGNFIGDSTEVTLVAENATKATYSIDGGEEVEFKNGDKITIGENLDFSEMLTLTLRGENEAGNKTCISYIFKKQDPITSGTKIYFEKPDNWDDRVCAYVYDESSSSDVQMNASWPGVEMTVEADGTYCYTFTETWTNPLVIFTDGSNQSNGAMEPGAAVIANKVYTVE